MANLMTEYFRRHGDQHVMATNDGICVFNEHKRPAMIALTSIAPKSLSCCANCAYPERGIAIEILEPSRDQPFALTSHLHVPPDTDIKKYIISNGYNNYCPVYLKNNRELEIWLWNFFLFHSRLRRSRNWAKTCSEQSETDEPTRTYEQMAQCAILWPKYFAQFYIMYQTVVSGRKYLIFE